MKIDDFHRRMTTKMFFEETTPGMFVKTPYFRLKHNFWADDQYKEIDNFYAILEMAFPIKWKLLSKKITLIFQTRS